MMKQHDEIILDSGWKYTVYLSASVKSYTIYDDTKYTVTGLSIEASHSHLDFTRYCGTLELFYDMSDYAYLVMKEKEIRKVQTLKPGIAAGYAFLFGKLSANVHLGSYLYAQNQVYGFVYQRLALRYDVARRANIHLGLKTHWGQADYVELAIGYRIL